MRARYRSVGVLGLVLGLGGAAALLPRVRADDDQKVPPKVREQIAEHDANGDGLIERSEWPETDAMFAEADKDGDGRLTPHEIYRYFTWDKVVKQLAQKDQLWKKAREVDRDGNGHVTREEFPAAEMLFDRIDRDGDEKIVMEELIAYAVEEELAKAFSKKDADLSGTLTREELDREGRELFELIDTDGDEQVSGEEAYAFLYAAQIEAQRRWAAGNDDGAMPRAGERKPPAGDAAGGYAALLGADRDGDGALTRAEFPGTSALHDLIDIDDDGRVDAAELGIRERFGRDLQQRAARIRAAAEQLDQSVVGPQVALIGKEIKGLFDAGRLEEVKLALDEVELRIERIRAGTRER